MSQPRQFQMGVNNAGHQFGDTTYTKIFVGGLAWETHRETMKRYFEQFGEIQEAVVITDKNTGRSKGYGFVTFKDTDAATRACQDPSPVIDGRRANCNLASLGANRTRPATPHHGNGRFRPVHGSVPASFPAASSTYSAYSQETAYPMNYYNVYGGSQFSPFYTTSGPGIFHNFYPYYAQYPQTSQAQGSGFGMQYLVQYPYVPQQYGTAGILSLPSPAPSNATGVTAVTGSGSSSQTGAGPTTTEQKNSAP
ncbi:uncharacterized protein [Aristolochia californica]|uniref:uncharacterized protein isoform X2 n=1 Tax=Aristolochia californica TaxID=171875 RepID=UPI0035E104B7